MQNPKVDDLLVIPIDHTSPNKDELEKIAKLYSQILVPEMDLVDYPKDELLAKASQLEGLISNISAVETADESSGRLKELVQKDVDLYKYFANTSRQTLEAVLDSDFSDICDDMISLNTANNKASPMPSFQSDAFEIASAIESPSLRHTASRQSVLTGVTNPIIRSLQDDPLSSIPPSPSGVFQWTVLRSISSHLKSMVSIHGDITSFDVSFALAFGTKSSVILVYSLEQKFLGPIGSAEQCYGSVSCLKFGEHKAHLIAGYSNGYVCIWDLEKKSSLKVVEPVPTPQIGSDGHKTGVSIIAVAMTTADKFYSADEKGAAFFHSIMSRILYTTVKSIRIHGRHTTPKRIVSAILSIKPLERSLTIPLKVDKLNLVAIASPFKISIFSMKPMPHIVFRATWDELGHAEKVDAKVRSAALSWWRPKSSKQENNPILAVSHGERLVLLKIFKALESSRLSSEVIARCKLEFPITAIEWLNSEFIVCASKDDKFAIYASRTLKMIETGSFESRENENSQGLANLLSQIGNTRLRMHSNRLFLFNDEIRFGNLLSWHERIDILAKAGDFQAAFKIGVEFYNGDIPVAALKIPHNIEERRTMKGLLVELLSNFVNMTVAGFDGEDTDVAHVISTTKLAVKTCIHIQEQSFLFGKMWDKYAEAGLETFYLEVIGECVLSELITMLPMKIIEAMFDNSAQDKCKLEQILLNLELKGLEIHYILERSKKLYLTSAIIYIYIMGFRDYITPVLEIINMCKLQDVSQRTYDIYILYLYISYSLTGKTFPLGLPNPDNAPEICNSILGLIMSKTSNSIEGEYPNLVFLLKANVAQMVNVLLNAMENEELEEGVLLNDSTILNRRLIVKIVHSFLSNDGWSQIQLDSIRCFIAKCYSKYSKSLSTLTSSEIEILCQQLLASNLEITYEERQTAMCLLYTSGLLPFIDEGDELYLSNLMNAGFWNVYETIAIRSGDYTSAVKSYLKTPKRLANAVLAVEKWMETPGFSEKFVDQIKKSVIAHADELAPKNLGLARLIDYYWPEEHQNVIDRLSENPTARFDYIGELLKLKPATIPKDRLFESYIELFLLQNPQQGIEYLDTFSNNEIPVSLDFVFNISKKHDILAGKIFVLARKGFYREAARLLMDKLSNCIAASNSFTDSDVSNLIKLCNFPPRNQEKVETWNFVLENFCSQINNSTCVSLASRQLLEVLINAAVEVISIPNVLASLLEFNTPSTFGFHKNLILSLLHRFTQEKETLEHALRLSRRTVFDSFEILTREAKSSFYPNPGHCQICKKLFHLQALTLLEQKENLIIFKCHHAFHINCLEARIEKVHKNLRLPGIFDEYDLWCHTCGIPSTKLNKGKSKMFFPSMPDVSAGTGDSARHLLETFDLINDYVYPKTEFVATLKSNTPKTEDRHDEICFNDEED